MLDTPAHHRVHHASKKEYLDANFGGVFIVFDRLFGTFVKEIAGVPIRYGLTEPARSYNPIAIGLREWFAITRDVWSSRSWRGAIASAFGPPLPSSRSSI